MNAGQADLLQILVLSQFLECYYLFGTAKERMRIKHLLIVIAVFFTLVVSLSAQDKKPVPDTQEAGDDGIPVIVKHLPDWESNYKEAVFFSEKEKFEDFFSKRDIISAIDFLPGTEAVYARYNEGSLLILENMTPQLAGETNRGIIAASKTTKDRFLYRKIGNYNVFLFDPTDKPAANRLLDQVKYQKIVTWPYGNPMPYFQKERDFIVGTRNLFVYTVLFILSGFGIAILIGLIIGIFYFRSMEKHRVELNSFSDAGGLTRLNLDGFSGDVEANARQLSD